LFCNRKKRKEAKAPIIERWSGLFVFCHKTKRLTELPAARAGEMGKQTFDYLLTQRAQWRRVSRFFLFFVIDLSGNL